MALTFSLTVYYARGGQMAGRWMPLWWATAAVALVIAAAYVLNDVMDISIDRYNAPRRPIASGRVRAGWALVLAAVLLAGGLAITSFWTPRMFKLVLAAVIAGLWIYDVYSKRMSVGKQLAVAALMTSIYPLAIAYTGGVTGSRAWTLLPFAVWMFLSSWAYELLKDIRDRKGDARATGLRRAQSSRRLNSVQRHPRLWRGVSSWLLAAGGLAALLPGLLGCLWVYRIASILIIGIVVLIVANEKTREKIVLIYAEFVLVGAAAILDVIICGF
jgi:4-hydroxybenzoate polyprenyltransferase